VLVFGSFILGGERIIELFGVGLASAVLLDALIVRSVLVPALMIMFGDVNWKIPAWLDRVLPQFNVEGASPPPVSSSSGHDATSPEPAAG
jgi:RND superfamily putative drug exporter